MDSLVTLTGCNVSTADSNQTLTTFTVIHTYFWGCIKALHGPVEVPQTHIRYFSISDGGPSNVHTISPYQMEVPQTCTLYFSISCRRPSNTHTVFLHIRWRSFKHTHYLSISCRCPSNTHTHTIPLYPIDVPLTHSFSPSSMYIDLTFVGYSLYVYLCMWVWSVN